MEESENNINFRLAQKFDEFRKVSGKKRIQRFKSSNSCVKDPDSIVSYDIWETTDKNEKQEGF
jgi:hypothetical protein